MFPIRGTVLVEGADQIVARLALFGGVVFSDPPLDQGRKFQALVLGRQVFVQESQGVGVEKASLTFGFLSQALFQFWRQV